MCSTEELTNSMFLFLFSTIRTSLIVLTILSATVAGLITSKLYFNTPYVMIIPINEVTNDVSGIIGVPITFGNIKIIDVLKIT